MLNTKTKSETKRTYSRSKKDPIKERLERMMVLENAPDDFLISAPDARMMIHVSHSHFWKLCRQNEFPQPTLKLANRERWHLGTVRKYLRGQAV